MKAKMHPVLVREDQLSDNEHVRREMRIFLQALDSYPERFARNPGVSFEEYCSGLAQQAKPEPRSRA